MNNESDANKIRREQYAQNPEPHKNNSKKHYEANKQEILERQKQYRELNQEKRKEINKKSYENNKEIHAINSKIKREAFQNENEKLTKEEIYKRTPVKYCPQCNLNHISDNFFIDKTKEDGLARICKMAKKINKEKN